MVDRLVNSEANARRIANVENCFGINGTPLAMPGRVLVGEGVLTKICRKKPKPRQVFLFNDILVYGSIIINKKKYTRQHIIPLEEVKLENLPDDDILKNGWLIKTSTKSFAVYAATPTEKVEWMAHINKCVEELLMRTGKQPSSEHAAVWVPDNEANSCMNCKKSQFTVINRRHHCRNCGVVVCGACSKNKFLLPQQASKPVRVCNSCFDTLSRSRMESFTSPAKRISATGGDSSSTDNGSGNDQTPRKSLNESSDSDDDKRRHSADDNLAKSLENLTIDEKPTFYGSDGNRSI